MGFSLELLRSARSSKAADRRNGEAGLLGAIAALPRSKDT